MVNSSCSATCKNFGNWYKCQLPDGHVGRHTHSITWNNEKQSGDNEFPCLGCIRGGHCWGADLNCNCECEKQSGENV